MPIDHGRGVLIVLLVWLVAGVGILGATALIAWIVGG